MLRIRTAALCALILASCTAAFAVIERGIIIREGIRRMFVAGEDGFYYLTLGNENYPMPPMPDEAEEGKL